MERVVGERDDERARPATGGRRGAPGGGATGDDEPGASGATGEDEPGASGATGEHEPVRVLVLVRAHCRTCDRMEDVVREMCLRAGEGYRTVDVDARGADPEWRAEYSDAIPVVLVDGVEVGSWHVDPADLARALAEPRR